MLSRNKIEIKLYFNLSNTNKFLDENLNLVEGKKTAAIFEKQNINDKLIRFKMKNKYLACLDSEPFMTDNKDDHSIFINELNNYYISIKKRYLCFRNNRLSSAEFIEDDRVNIRSIYIDSKVNFTYFSEIEIAAIDFTEKMITACKYDYSLFKMFKNPDSIDICNNKSIIDFFQCISCNYILDSFYILSATDFNYKYFQGITFIFGLSGDFLICYKEKDDDQEIIYGDLIILQEIPYKIIMLEKNSSCYIFHFKIELITANK